MRFICWERESNESTFKILRLFGPVLVVYNFPALMSASGGKHVYFERTSQTLYLRTCTRALNLYDKNNLI